MATGDFQAATRWSLHHVCKMGTTLVLTLTVLAAPSTVTGNQPSWWLEHGALSADPADDHAAATQGQVKHFAQRAFHYLEAELADVGGAGEEIAGMVQSFTETHNGELLQLGQLKWIAAPFYRRLHDVGYSASYVPTGHIYPWGSGHGPQMDTALANLGQLKYVFQFDLVDFDLGDLWNINLIVEEETSRLFTLHNPTSEPIDLSFVVSGDLHLLGAGMPSGDTAVVELLPPSTTVLPGASITVRLRINVEGLAPGEYVGRIAMSSSPNGLEFTPLQVRVTVSEPPPGYDLWQRAREYQYDSIGRLTQAVLADGLTHNYVYDENSNILTAESVGPEL